MNSFTVNRGAICTTAADVLFRKIGGWWPRGFWEKADVTVDFQPSATGPIKKNATT